ncbi:hypothetical protein [Amycolatopsis sp. WGS_07]|uniref:hypothetical protein n=1 Tax=Amycolatopsis sp. WGS_07 TaxID=3076764 RepID=UPI00387357B3
MNYYSSAENLRSGMLRASGLVVLEASSSFDGPAPMDAWRVIISGNAVPTARVATDSEFDYLSEVDRTWESVAEELGIFGNDREFLISVAGSPIGRLPWVRVRPARDLSLARHLVNNPEEPEFVAMSVDARVICGVTTEEYEIWIVGADLA